MSKRNNSSQDSPMANTKYLGNIFGWKFSFFALAFLVAFGALLAFRLWYVDMPVNQVFDTLEEELAEPVVSDTLVKEVE